MVKENNDHEGIIKRLKDLMSKDKGFKDKMIEEVSNLNSLNSYDEMIENTGSNTDELMNDARKKIINTNIDLDSAKIIKSIPTVKGIDQIRSILEHLINNIVCLNPLTEKAKHRNERLAENRLILHLKNNFGSEFILPNSYRFLSYLTGCIKEITRLEQIARSKGLLIDLNRSDDFEICHGGLMNIYNLINPKENRLELKDVKNGNDFYKIINEVLLRLASISSLKIENDEKLEKKQVESVYQDLLVLSDEEKKVIVLQTLDIRWLLEIEQKTQKQIHELLIAFDPFVLGPYQLISHFSKSTKSDREKILTQILNECTAQEIKIIENRLKEDNK